MCESSHLGMQDSLNLPMNPIYCQVDGAKSFLFLTMRLNSIVQTSIRNEMTVTKVYAGDNIRVTLELPKDLKISENCPCDRSLVVYVEGLLLHLQRPRSKAASPA